jgi:methyl-accepting chemotaxis protein
MLKKFLFAILVVVFLPLASLWYTNGYKLQIDLEQEVNEDLTQTADLLAAKVDDWTDMNLRLLNQNSSLSQMISGKEYLQKPILESMVDTYEWLYLAYAIGSDGFKTARSDDKPILEKDGTKAHYRGDRSYFKQIQVGSKTSQELVLSRTLKKPAFILCQALSAPNVSFTQSGALCIGSTVSDLSESVVKTKIGKTGYAMLLDGSNKVIAHGKPGVLKEQLQDLSSEPVVTEAIYDRPYFYQNGNKQMIAYMKAAGSGWNLIITQEYEDAYSALDVAKRSSLILLFVTVLLSVVMSYFMARLLARPIQKLTAIANDIRKGKLYNSIDESARSDEIGELARAIEKMSISISIAFKKLKSK